MRYFGLFFGVVAVLLLWHHLSTSGSAVYESFAGLRLLFVIKFALVSICCLFIRR